MKKIITLFCFFVTIQPAFNQIKTTDSLKIILAKTTDPLERFGLLNKISEDVFINGDGNIDSAFCIQMITIAQELDNDSLLAIGYNMAGSFFFLNKGDNTTGLEYLFKAIPLAERIN